jgi:hypothetical protein
MHYFARFWLFVCYLMQSYNASAQLDTIYFHNGQVGVATILQIDEDFVRFRYKGEEAERIAGRYAIERVLMRSGRMESFSSRVDPIGVTLNDVVVITDAVQAKGLRKVVELSSQTAFLNFHTSTSGTKKAQRKILEEAASKGCEFVLFTQDIDKPEGSLVIFRVRIWGFVQHKSKAIGYSY